MEDLTQPQERQKNENQVISGADWFFWIAGLSIVNSVIILANGDWNFLIGLGITTLISVMAKNAGTAGLVMAIFLDIVVAGFLVVFGIFARRKNNWAFIAGMILYAVDGILFLLVSDYLSIGFHAFALFFIFRGLQANIKLAKMPKGIASTPNP